MKITRDGRKKRIIIYLLSITLVMLFSGFVSKICFAKNIMCTLSSPDEDVLNTIRVKINTNKQNVFYYATDFTSKGHGNNDYIIPAGFLAARTEYQPDFQPLDNSVLFLAANQDEAEVVLKLSKEAWHLVPAGKYEGDLISIGGKKDYKVTIEIIKEASLIIYPDSISITATDGPGTYQGDNKVTLNINNYNRQWVLTITAEPLIKEDVVDNPSLIPPGNLYLAIDNPDGPYYNLGQGYQLDGFNYGNRAIFDIYLRARVDWSHQAGNYSGDIIFTLSEQ
jgi:hypothetical protein